MPVTNLILQTKFFFPMHPTDFISRNNIVAKLNYYQNCPVTLVSAPTGYGKSTLISEWVQNCGVKTSWLSLDENENDFNTFVLYFTTAIQKQIKGFGEEIIELCNSRIKVPVYILSEQIQMALSQIKEPLFLVLDDYHLIRNKEINHFFF